MKYNKVSLKKFNNDKSKFEETEFDKTFVISLKILWKT